METGDIYVAISIVVFILGIVITAHYSAEHINLFDDEELEE